MFKTTPNYVLISGVFFILIGIGFAYSYFFYPNSHPVDCVIKAATGKDCPSCGFSRAFSYYTHFQLEEGKKFNALSWPVFLFFLMQFFIRAIIVFYFVIQKKSIHSTIIKLDSIVSILGFLLAFLPIILKI